jgi:hypothetical protein
MRGGVRPTNKLATHDTCSNVGNNRERCAPPAKRAKHSDALPNKDSIIFYGIDSIDRNNKHPGNQKLKFIIERKIKDINDTHTVYDVARRVAERFREENINVFEVNLESNSCFQFDEDDAFSIILLALLAALEKESIGANAASQIARRSSVAEDAVDVNVCLPDRVPVASTISHDEAHPTADDYLHVSDSFVELCEFLDDVSMSSSDSDIEPTPLPVIAPEGHFDPGDEQFDFDPEYLDELLGLEVGQTHCLDIPFEDLTYPVDFK